MSVFRKCPFYRISASVAIGQGLGHCDFDGSQTICDGDMSFCEKPDAVKKYFEDQYRKKEKGAATNELLDSQKPANFNRKSSYSRGASRIGGLQK
jgi:hypothetical protein